MHNTCRIYLIKVFTTTINNYNILTYCEMLVNKGNETNDVVW